MSEVKLNEEQRAVAKAAVTEALDSGPWPLTYMRLTGIAAKSLDAALALAERVLPWGCVGLCQASPGNWQAWIGGRPAFASVYRTAPLALCIAILKARTAAETGAVGTDVSAASGSETHDR